MPVSAKTNPSVRPEANKQPSRTPVHSLDKVKDQAQALAPQTAKQRIGAQDAAITIQSIFRGREGRKEAEKRVIEVSDESISSREGLDNTERFKLYCNAVKSKESHINTLLTDGGKALSLSLIHI